MESDYVNRAYTPDEDEDQGIVITAKYEPEVDYQETDKLIGGHATDDLNAETGTE
jgi:hypothetical protein